MIGGSRQSVNRLLADFAGEGLLRFDGDDLVDPGSEPPGARGRAVTDGSRTPDGAARGGARRAGRGIGRRLAAATGSRRRRRRRS